MDPKPEWMNAKISVSAAQEKTLNGKTLFTVLKFFFETWNANVFLLLLLLIALVMIQLFILRLPAAAILALVDFANGANGVMVSIPGEYLLAPRADDNTKNKSFS